MNGVIRSRCALSICICIAAILFAGCAGATNQSTPIAGPQSQFRISDDKNSRCPCLYVADVEDNAVTVYASGATGNATPIRDISGAKTGLNSPEDVALDGRANIYVANASGSSSYTGAVTVYAADATGNVAPTATIQGSNTGLDLPFGIAINPVNGDIYVANLGANSYVGSVTIYPSSASGNVAPVGVIEGSKTRLNIPVGIALDRNGNVYVANEGNVITIYAAGSTGNVAPALTIRGRKTKLQYPNGLALDSSANIYVSNSGKDSIAVYAAGAHGNVAPIQLIKGKATKLNWPWGVAVDGAKNIYAADFHSGLPSASITTYPARTTGNVAPSNRIKGMKTDLSGPHGIAIH